MNQKGFANIILVVGIVILLGVVGYFAFVKNSPQVIQQTNTSTSTQSSSMPTSIKANAVKTKPIDLAGKYIFEVPDDFTVTKDTFISPDGHYFSIFINPYASAESQIPGKCVVSKNFDAGILSAPIFCEGLNLVDSFIISGNQYVKYGTVVSDMSLECTMNSQCPRKVPAETRYSKEYVFVVPDKSHNAIVEFFAGDVARGPSNKVNGFEGVSATLHDIVIPSLTAK